MIISNDISMAICTSSFSFDPLSDTKAFLNNGTCC